MQSIRREIRCMRWSVSVARGLSILLVGVQLLGLAHLALARHGFCWEHGTFTELAAGRVVTAASAAGSTASGLNSGQSGTHVEDVEDRACPVQASRRHWVSPPEVSALALFLGPELGNGMAAEPSSRADDALLLRAPKQSPPRSA